MLILTSNAYSQVKSENMQTVKLKSAEMNKKCEPNQENRYNRVKMLEKLGTILDETMISYYNAKYRIKKKPAKNPKFVIDERPNGFFVYDLTDTSNKTEPLGGCIEFKDNHIYHFALIHLPYSFSHIVILEEGQLQVFRAINCNDSQDKIKDVLDYLEPKLKDEKDKEEIIGRVKNYRKHGIYGAIDDDILQCPEVK